MGLNMNNFYLIVCVCVCVRPCYLEVWAGPVQVLDLSLDLHQSVAVLVKLLQLLLLLPQLLLVQLLPENHHNTCLSMEASKR